MYNLIFNPINVSLVEDVVTENLNSFLNGSITVVSKFKEH